MMNRKQWPQGAGQDCLTADTYLHTADGVLTIEEILNAWGLKAGCSNRREPEVEERLVNEEIQLEATSAFSKNNRRTVFAVRARDGTYVKATARHPFRVMGELGVPIWRTTENLKGGDFLLRPREIPFFGDRRLESLQTAYFLGICLADAHFGETLIAITNDQPHIQTVIRTAGAELLETAPVEYDADPSIDFRFTKRAKVEAFYKRFGMEPTLAAGKHVPMRLRRLERSHLAALIRGYIDCEGYADESSLEVTSASWELLRQLRLMLQQFGIHASVRPKVASNYPENDYYRLLISGGDLETYRSEIGSEVHDLPVRQQEGESAVIPDVGRWVETLMAAATRTTREHWDLAYDLMAGKTESTQAVQKLLDAAEWGQPHVEGLLRSLLPYEYVELESVERVGQAPTFDVELPSSTYLAEGAIVRSTTV